MTLVQYSLFDSTPDSSTHSDLTTPCIAPFSVLLAATLSPEPTCNTDEVVVAEIVGGVLTASKFLPVSEGVTWFCRYGSLTPQGSRANYRWRRTYFVAVCGAYAIVVANTSKDYVNPSGIFHVIDVASERLAYLATFRDSPTLSALPQTALLLRLRRERA
jgi:hypothetical protein